ncbi:Membrane-associated, eicosanoid/glutathione metabolism (MAPEG) protein [Phaffia rhodozyma]|uniref:Membrane-associated, eicosanoid/glutathione metabolism (MAPEG) protein n=1 Tax=Phaffia rhodozyma TaxID=264483 RepID=A0A0F7SKD0_PHARH|nr:Membrane-associated, eicosanoid/glutathione metabolism (MAPEG) protein [Phaffia rhodozyma]
MFFFPNGAYNYSLYTVPVAWILSLTPHLYAVNRWNSLRKDEWDNSNPRGFLNQLQKKEKLTKEEKVIVRAEAAQQNGFENLPFFAVALLAGNYAKLSNSTLNNLAATYLITRAFYNLAYIKIDNNRLAPIRTVLFLSGIGCCFTLFVKSANALF